LLRQTHASKTGIGGVSYSVFYLNPGATDDVLEIIRGEMPEGWRLLSAQGNDHAAALAESDFILVPGQPVTEQHLAAAGKLLMVQHQGVGYEKVDLAACRARRIPLCLTPEGTTIGVAEHTILLILGLYKQLVTAANGVRAGRWMEWELRSTSFELCGKTVGLIGFGRIGREVARRLLAFDARVLYYDPLVTAAENANIVRSESLAALLAASDIVSVHVPVTHQSRNFVNADFLKRMKPSAVLINTARGALVDEPALVEALQGRRIAGAALDVLQQEPPDPKNPLLHLDNVLVTPHIAAGTRDALKTKMRAAFANMVRRTRGEPLWHLVPELADLFEGTP
jgi:phosphoglycerate dehydrogenase-like enzyme